jgi:SAM-dependent methyltransferase
MWQARLDVRRGWWPVWDATEAYEQFMGRWSAAVADALLDEVSLPPGGRCLDVGCGVGSLSRVITVRLHPRYLMGVDRSAAFLRLAAQNLPHLQPVQADASRLPFAASTFDIAVSGLVLNFVPVAGKALAEVTRVLRPGGVFLAYVWDYDHPHFFLARFWAGLAVVLGERASEDERGRWRLCTPEGLNELVEGSSLVDVRIAPLVIETTFADRQALWDGFLLGAGPSGQAVRALDPVARERLREWLNDDWPLAEKGRVRLTARALSLVANVGD